MAKKHKPKTSVTRDVSDKLKEALKYVRYPTTVATTSSDTKAKRVPSQKKLVSTSPSTPSANLKNALKHVKYPANSDTSKDMLSEKHVRPRKTRNNQTTSKVKLSKPSPNRSKTLPSSFQSTSTPSKGLRTPKATSVTEIIQNQSVTEIPSTPIPKQEGKYTPLSAEKRFAASQLSETPVKRQKRSKNAVNLLHGVSKTHSTSVKKVSKRHSRGNKRKSLDRKNIACNDTAEQEKICNTAPTVSAKKVEPAASPSESSDDVMECETTPVIVNDSSTNTTSINDQQKIIFLVTDTNVFLHNLSHLKTIVAVPVPKGELIPVIYVPWMVIQELDRFKSGRVKTIMQQEAIAACRFMHTMLSETSNRRLRGQTITEADQCGKATQVVTVPGPDDHVLFTCLNLRERGERVMLFSNDVNLRNKAMINNIDTVDATSISDKISWLKCHFSRRFSSQSSSPTILRDANITPRSSPALRKSVAFSGTPRLKNTRGNRSLNGTVTPNSADSAVSSLTTSEELTVSPLLPQERKAGLVVAKNYLASVWNQLNNVCGTLCERYNIIYPYAYEKKFSALLNDSEFVFSIYKSVSLSNEFMQRILKNSENNGDPTLVLELFKHIRSCYVSLCGVDNCDVIPEIDWRFLHQLFSSSQDRELIVNASKQLAGFYDLLGKIQVLLEKQ